MALHLTTFEPFHCIWLEFGYFQCKTWPAVCCPGKKIHKKIQNIDLHGTAYSCIGLFLRHYVTFHQNLGISNVFLWSRQASCSSGKKFHKKVQNIVLHGTAFEFGCISNGIWAVVCSSHVKSSSSKRRRKTLFCSA